MQAHAIPQNIMQYEFKLVAGLTVKQLIFVAIGGGSAYVAYILMQQGALPEVIGWPIILAVIVLTVAIALVPIRGRSFDLWLQDYSQAMKNPTRRVWNKTHQIVQVENVMQTKPAIFPEYFSIYLTDELNTQAVQAQVNAKVAAANTVPADNTTSSPVLVIDPTTYSQYAINPKKKLKDAQTLAFEITDTADLPLNGVVALLKNPEGQTSQALRANDQGIIFFNKQLFPGVYQVEFQLEGHQLPTVQATIDGTTAYPILKIKETVTNAS